VLNAVLFVADPHLASLLQGMAGESSEFSIESIAELARTDYAVARTLSTHRPDVALVEMTDLERDLPVAAAIQKNSPEVPVVALAGSGLEFQLNRGFHELASYAVWPFNVLDLERAISGAVHKLHGQMHDNLLSFLPGKAGSGASTVVLQTARTLAQELKKRVLVMDGDLHSGLMSAMLNVAPRFSIREALAEAPALDSMAWQRLVAPVGGIDFLLANPAVKEPVPHWTHYFQLLRFAVPRYDFVLMDLPEVVNPATAEVVRRSRAVHVVSTPEFASLKLSKQRCLELESWGVGKARIFGLLNREHRDDLGAKDAEQILGVPIARSFPNDYRAVQKAVKEARFIDPRSSLGEAYLAFSKTLCGVAEEKKGFMGLFKR
jgi:pilus assembly protein CpaE